MFGATVLGTGMMLSAGDQRPVRTAGVPAPPPRLMGVRLAEPSHPPASNAEKPAKPPTTPPTVKPPTVKPPVAPPNRTLGKIRVEPTPIDTPPRLMGDVMVVPKPDGPAQGLPKKEDPAKKEEPPKSEGPPPLPGVPPPR